MNEQKPTPARSWDETYAVHSIFKTIQGEGPFSGEGAIFIRLEGCNLQCPFCDTDYTGGPRAQSLSADELVAACNKLIGTDNMSLIVITGGEPFRQDLAALVKALMDSNLRVQIETNGTMAPSDAFKELFRDKYGIGIVVSPKAHYVDDWIFNHAISFKYVLTAGQINSKDGLPTIALGRKGQQIARPPAWIAPIYIQPADMGDDAVANLHNIEACISSAQKFGYRMQLQIHKYAGVE